MDSQTESITAGQILDGKALAAEIRRKLAVELEDEQKKDPSFHPGLAILQVGGREDSNVYIRMKTKAANEVHLILNTGEISFLGLCLLCAHTPCAL